MIDGTIHWWKIARLQRKAEKVRRDYRRRLLAAKGEERERLSFEASHDEGELIDEIEHLQDRRLSDIARRYLVPLPDFDTKEGSPYEKSEHTGRWRLTRPEMHKLRSAIRAERKEAFESWSRWVALVMPIVSLVIAIVALLKK